jgi:hypothetical protein
MSPLWSLALSEVKGAVMPEGYVMEEVDMTVNEMVNSVEIKYRR